MMNKKTLLVVDDNPVNRKILVNLFNGEYTIIEAENGVQAIEVLKKSAEDISLILLDIIMPVMNGYEFLEVIKEDVRFSQIPVIVETSSESQQDEVKSLAAGASDFITKPYSPEVVRHRVSSIIRLRESAATINMLERDLLTGLYTKEFFYRYVRKTIDDHPEKKYDILFSDIEQFKLINERYGTKRGDAVLCQIASDYTNVVHALGLCSRIDSDKFAMLIEHGENYYPDEIADGLKKWQKNFPVPNLTVKFGVYRDVDRKLPVSAMCDRAIFALNSIKGKYGKFVAEYDDALRVRLLREQKIIEDMEAAVEQGQFVIHYQPKHDIQAEVLAGAEALVRWEHPEFGMLSPGEFIPLFEKNGFITKLDYYVWEQVCRTIRDWKDNNLPVVPVSVNVSRADFEAPKLVERIKELVDQYELEPSLLHLEVTETAYTNNPILVVNAVKRLRLLGFKIEMDDFGSGYSSLNMLSELPVDVLKLDMRFIQQGSVQRKSILSFIIALAKWLDLGTVAEGVETEEQIEILKGMGCQYVQGYFFAKPMCRQAFDAYILQYTAKPVLLHEPPEDIVPMRELTSVRTILVAEDIETNRDAVKKMLGSQYDVVGVADGQAAMDYLHEHGRNVSLLLLDLMMPVMDGFQVLEEMRKCKRLLRIPVIITSEAGKDSEIRALRLGAESFIAKPYEQEILLHDVKRAIEGAELRQIKAQLEAQRNFLKEEAYQDSLARCLNRRGMWEAISELPTYNEHAVLMLDVDNLKICNDTNGHAAGDALLQRVSSILTDETRDGDIIARIGGDEFVVVMKNLSNPQLALKKGTQVAEVLSAERAEGKYSTVCSIGVSIFGRADTFEDALRRADRALYIAKQTKKGSCVLWSADF